MSSIKNLPTKECKENEHLSFQKLNMPQNLLVSLAFSLS